MSALSLLRKWLGFGPRKKSQRRAGAPPRYDRVLLTKNTEYYMFRDACVAVFRPERGLWDNTHPALGHRLVGGIRMEQGRPMAAYQNEEPAIGDRACFTEEIVTSPLLGIVQPSVA